MGIWREGGGGLKACVFSHKEAEQLRMPIIPGCMYKEFADLRNKFIIFAVPSFLRIRYEKTDDIDY